MKYIYLIILFVVSFFILFWSIECIAFWIGSLISSDDPTLYYNHIAIPLLGALVVVCTSIIASKINKLSIEKKD